MTVPLPSPAALTVRRGWRSNLAVTAASSCMVSVHEPVPWHAPPQPANNQPGAASADRVTSAHTGYSAVQAFPQLIPPGALLTLPLPALLTTRVRRGDGATPTRDESVV